MPLRSWTSSCYKKCIEYYPDFNYFAFFPDNTVEETAAINSVKSMLKNITFDPIGDHPKEFNFTHPIAWSYM